MLEECQRPDLGAGNAHGYKQFSGNPSVAASDLLDQTDASSCQQAVQKKKLKNVTVDKNSKAIN